MLTFIKITTFLNNATTLFGVLFGRCSLQNFT